MTSIRLVLLGGGGHASDVLGALRACNHVSPRFDVLGCVDDGDPDRRRLGRRGLPYLGPIPALASHEPCAVIGAVGYPAGRRAMVERAKPVALCPAVIHPTAVVGEDVSFGAGTVCLALTQISALVTVGANVLISYGALVGHDCVIADDCSIMPGAVLSGEVRVGTGALIGTNATVLEGRMIGAGARVGAGCVVTRDVPAGATVMGEPARQIERIA